MLEKAKYEAMWNFPRYRQVSPGERAASLFMEVVNPPENSTITDFGAGTGRGAAMLAKLGKLQVHMLDFAANCLDPDVLDIPGLDFEQHNLTEPYLKKSKYGYCTDVMEHIPPHEVDKVLTNVLNAADHIFLQIDCKEDICGALIGESLHLSIHPYSWWSAKFKELEATIHWSKDFESNCCFYVSAKGTKFDLKVTTVCNTSEEEIRRNITTNIKRKLPWLKIEPTNNRTLAIVASGPSLENYLPLLHNSCDIMALNGAYKYLLNHPNPYNPKYCMLVDPREVNKNFFETLMLKTHFILAAQVHPSIFDLLSSYKVSLLNLLDPTTTDVLKDNDEEFMYVGGGGTVGITALAVAVGLGYRRLKLFGYDSSYRGDMQHVAHQEQNTSNRKFDVWVGEQEFFTTAALAKQVENFLPFLKLLIDEYKVEVQLMCDGLLPAYVRANQC